ncbi:inosine-5'-monophosphate dehydrogenase [Weissella oryzae SG25]|uniref:Inosine-5'-monophosphate dehydrogenase n=1 Tax=Weissella oryzae (strain DSM 25784 / JCM 18191 / LMG 30913 / SG25) TaxID=1329250 RepID=A0A069CS97_WEIOS|nr:IMP dehydrogenase [Weissella oryzae]GAK30309.1 inosine-5'-monophosphate dehydrogenase [Weissella oryzae SG25]
MANFSIKNKFIPLGLTFDDVQLKAEQNQTIAPEEVLLNTSLTPTLQLKLPLLSAAMDTVTEARFATALALLGGMGVIHKNMLIEEQAKQVQAVKDFAFKLTENPNAAIDSENRLLVAGAVGVTSDTLKRVAAMVDAGADAIVLDSAHGHSEGVLRKVREVRTAFPDLNIIAGNVATAAGTQALYDAGADVVKIGIGPGSICTTRVVAGVGVPQISAIQDAAKIAQKMGKAIIADGGAQTALDVVKAMASGGTAVMLGSMFAGILEGPGEVYTEPDGTKYKSYRGMGSIAAMENGSKDRYFQGEVNEANKMVPEGIEAKTAYKGDLTSVLSDLVAAMRLEMADMGISTVKALNEQVETTLAIDIFDFEKANRGPAGLTMTTF